MGKRLTAITFAAMSAILMAQAQAEPAQFGDVIKRMPANLTSKIGETEREAGARRDWLVDNLKGKRVVLTFNVAAQDKQHPDKHHGTVQKNLRVEFTLDDARIYKSDRATVEGDVKSINQYAGSSGTRNTPAYDPGNIIVLENVKIVGVSAP